MKPGQSAEQRRAARPPWPRGFVSHDFDMKWLPPRDRPLSATYQRSWRHETRPTALDGRNFSHAPDPQAPRRGAHRRRRPGHVVLVRHVQGLASLGGRSARSGRRGPRATAATAATTPVGCSAARRATPTATLRPVGRPPNLLQSIYLPERPGGCSPRSSVRTRMAVRGPRVRWSRPRKPGPSPAPSDSRAGPSSAALSPRRRTTRRPTLRRRGGDPRGLTSARWLATPGRLGSSRSAPRT